MFTSYQLAGLGKKFPYYQVMLPPSLWFKFDRNLQSKKSQLIELILRNILLLRDDHDNAINFALINSILENNWDNYLSNSEIIEIKKTQSFISAYHIFHKNENIVDFSTEEYREAASNSFVKNEERRMFGSKIFFRIMVCVDCFFGLLTNKMIIALPLPIFLLVFNFDRIRWFLKINIIDYFDVALYAFVFYIIALFVLLLLLFAVSMLSNIVMFPYFTFLYITDPIKFEAKWFLYKVVTLNDLTPYMAYCCSLIFYIMLIYYCREALNGKRRKEFML